MWTWHCDKEAVLWAPTQEYLTQARRSGEAYMKNGRLNWDENDKQKLTKWRKKKYFWGHGAANKLNLEAGRNRDAFQSS